MTAESSVPTPSEAVEHRHVWPKKVLETGCLDWLRGGNCDATLVDYIATLEQQRDEWKVTEEDILNALPALRTKLVRLQEYEAALEEAREERENCYAALTATALYAAKVEEGRLQAQTGQDVLRAMVERATMALRAFSEADDEAMSPDSVRAEARRTLREMRKIGGVN